MTKMWSEKAIEAALDAWYPGEDWRSVFGEQGTKRQIDEMRAALDAAQAVDRAELSDVQENLKDLA